MLASAPDRKGCRPVRQHAAKAERTNFQGARLQGAGIAYTLRRSDGSDKGATFSQAALITPNGLIKLADDSCVVEGSQPLDDRSWYTLENRSDNSAAPGLLRECSEAISGRKD